MIIYIFIPFYNFHMLKNIYGFSLLVKENLSFFYQSTFSGFHILAKAAMKYVSWHAISTGRHSIRSYSTQKNFQMYKRQNVFL